MSEKFLKGDKKFIIVHYYFLQYQKVTREKLQKRINNLK